MFSAAFSAGVVQRPGSCFFLTSTKAPNFIFLPINKRQNLYRSVILFDWCYVGSGSVANFVLEDQLRLKRLLWGVVWWVCSPRARH